MVVTQPLVVPLVFIAKIGHRHLVDEVPLEDGRLPGGWARLVLSTEDFVHGFNSLTFGKPLTSDWEDAGGLLHSGEYATATTTRGFSAHEHLVAHGLIHMNGRA
jgi:hypothetical protein